MMIEKGPVASPNNQTQLLAFGIPNKQTEIPIRGLISIIRISKSYFQGKVCIFRFAQVIRFHIIIFIMNQFTRVRAESFSGLADCAAIFIPGACCNGLSGLGGGKLRLGGLGCGK